MPVVREQSGGRDPASRGRFLTMADSVASQDRQLLRPALELAVAVARRDPEAAPAKVRRVLGFSRLKGPAWSLVRDAVESDAGFRSEVAADPGAADVGEVGRLWLARPEGWRDRFDQLVAEATAEAGDRAERQDLRRAQRALEGAQASRAKAEARAVDAQQRAERLAGSLAEQRSGAAAGAARQAELEAEVRRLGVERARAVKALEQLEEVHRRTVGEASEVAKGTAVSDAPEAVPPPTASSPEKAAGPSRPNDQASATSSVSPPRAPGEAVDLTAVSGDVRRAARAEAALAASLAAVANALTGSTAPAGIALPPAGSDVTSPPLPRTRHTVGRSGRAAVAPRRPHGSGRRPARLPPAVLEDSVEAAAFLVRLSRVVVLVDGYNVSKTAWNGLALVDQRERLIAALDGLSSRTGADPVIVFDGVEAGGLLPGSGSRSRATRVRFTDAEVEADDVVLSMVEQFPPGRPVVVVSSDRRVQEGARAQGANVIGSHQLLATLDLRRE